MSITLDLQLSLSDQTNIPDLQSFQLWAENAILPFKPNAELTIRVVDEAESQELNYNYRAKNKPTNVLSFPFETPFFEELLFLAPNSNAMQQKIAINLIGDLVICKQVVENESIEQKKPLQAHWAHMVVHGCLHLLGFDHINVEDAKEMENHEIVIMKNMGFNDPYLII